MQRRKRAIMSRVHRLQHVESLRPTAFPDDDAIWSHTERIDDQITDGDFPPALRVAWASLKPNDMGMLKEAQLRRILDGDNALIMRYDARQGVEQRGLPTSRATRNGKASFLPHSRNEKSPHTPVKGSG